eukprot:7116427-Prymnesium_polylepis.1
MRRDRSPKKPPPSLGCSCRAASRAAASLLREDASAASRAVAASSPRSHAPALTMLQSGGEVPAVAPAAPPSLPKL